MVPPRGLCNITLGRGRESNAYSFAVRESSRKKERKKCPLKCPHGVTAGCPGATRSALM